MRLLLTVAHSGIHGTVRDRTMACARSQRVLQTFLSVANFHALWQLGDQDVVLSLCMEEKERCLPTHSSWRMTFNSGTASTFYFTHCQLSRVAAIAASTNQYSVPAVLAHAKD